MRELQQNEAIFVNGGGDACDHKNQDLQNYLLTVIAVSTTTLAGITVGFLSKSSVESTLFLGMVSGLSTIYGVRAIQDANKAEV